MSSATKTYPLRALRNPWLTALAIAVCICTLAFSPKLADVSNIVRFTLLALSGVLFAFSSPTRSFRIPSSFGTAAFLLFVIVQGLSLLWAPNSAEGLFDFSKWILVAAVILLTFNIAQQNLARFIVSMSRASASVVIIALAVVVWQMADVGDLSFKSRYGFTSLFTHKGTFSAILLMTTAFPIMRLRLRFCNRGWFYIIMIAVAFGMILFLQSRATLVAVVATAASALLIWLLQRRVLRHKWLWTIILALIATCTILASSRWIANQPCQIPSQNSGLKANATIVERQALWKMTFRMIDNHPLLGCGTGNWKICYPDAGTGDVFSIDMLDLNFVRPHNDYLRILAETGYPALLLIILALSSLIVNAISTNRNRRLGSVARISAAFLCGMMAFAFFDFPIDRIETILWTSLLVATLSAAITNGRISHNSTVYKSVITLLLFLIFLLGTSRWRSEKKYPAITTAIHNSRWEKVERLSHKATTPFYNINPLGMPMAYYEAMALEQQHKETLPTFRKALAASPYCKQVLSDIGRLQYTENHNADSAITFLEEAIRISPSYSRSYINLTQVYYLENRHCDALEVAKRFNIKRKKELTEKLVWHYFQVKEAEYYTQSIIPSEEKTMENIIESASLLCEQQNDGHQKE